MHFIKLYFLSTLLHHWEKYQRRFFCDKPDCMNLSYLELVLQRNMEKSASVALRML